jgi:hypothetical protein
LIFAENGQTDLSPPKKGRRPVFSPKNMENGSSPFVFGVKNKRILEPRILKKNARGFPLGHKCSIALARPASDRRTSTPLENFAAAAAAPSLKILFSAAE